MSRSTFTQNTHLLANTLEVEIKEGQRDAYPCYVRPTKTPASFALIKSCEAELESLLLRFGAILFDGFEMRDIRSFSMFASALCSELFEENFEHPLAEGSQNIYRTTPYPADLPLLSHNENSHLDTWPGKIIFGCLRPSAVGGQTLVSDSAAMVRLIPQKLQNDFETRGILYQRIFGGGLGLDWRTAFKTDDRKLVSKKCEAGKMEYTWLDAERLRIRWRRRATQIHPALGLPLWFNQVTHFHPALLPDGLGEALRLLYSGDELPRNCYYGDGENIPDEVACTISDIYKSVEFGGSWKDGQVLLIDNMRLAHSRMPYKGEREILVALGDMIHDDNH